MKKEPTASVEPTPEQVCYAGILEKGMRLGLACLFVTFAIYVFGVLQPYIPVEELDEHWSNKAHVYLEQAEIDPGWGWVWMLGYGDFLNFVGIAFLAGVTIICYIAIIPLLFKQKDTVYAILATLEVIILTLAASGIISVSH